MKQWRCTVCGYIHTGDEPPAECPVCGAPREAFELVEASETAIPAPGAGGPAAISVVPTGGEGAEVNRGLFAITYGLFMVSSRQGEKLNGQTCNTVFQITSKPNQIAIGINQANQTHAYIKDSGICAITVLSQDDLWAVRHFGFQSGWNVDKFANLTVSLGPETGCPLLPGSVSYLECRIRPEVSSDLGTHTLFVAEVLGGGALRGGTPITYEYYRQNKNRP